MRGWLLSVVAALAGCSKPAAPTNTAAVANAVAPAANVARAPAAAPSQKLAKIFTADILGANIAYLETITGPAFRTEGKLRTYKVDDCTVLVGSGDGVKIDNIGVDDYGPHCSFPIAQYFASGSAPSTPDIPTFGQLRQSLDGRFTASCLHLCGNAADPTVMWRHQGSHADNFNDLLAEVPVREDPVLDAYEDWANKLIAKYGEDYVERRRYDQGDNLDDVVAHDFANIRPTRIRVGSNLDAADE